MAKKIIYADDAIDALEQAKEQYFDRRVIIGKMQDIVNNLPSAQPEVLAHGEGELSAQPEQRWIPCSERLPEEKDAGILKKLGTSKRSDNVLATVEVKDERMTVMACTHDGAWHWEMRYAFPDYEVVAWMPLPEPWRGEEHGV